MKTDFTDVYELLQEIVKRAEAYTIVNDEVRFYKVPAELITRAANLVE